MAESVAKARWQALRDIDRAAGEARLRYITDVPGQQAVYMVKLQEAAAYVAAYAANPQTAMAGPYIAAEAVATGATALAVAEMVVGLGSAWNGVVGPAIEGARLGGKGAVAAAAGASDDETRAAIAQACAAALAALAAI